MQSINLWTRVNSKNWIKLINNINKLWKLRQYGIIFLASMEQRDQEHRRNQKRIRNLRKKKTSRAWGGEKTFFNCYLTAPRPTMAHSQGDSLTNPTLITALELSWSEGHREPRNEVSSLNPVERLVGFKLGTFRF